MSRQYGATSTRDPFQHQLVSSIICPTGYQTLPSPTKHVTVVAQPPLQPQQQYVPVSMVEAPATRQMLFTNAAVHQAPWPNNRQMALVPPWQQITSAHSGIREPLLSTEATANWGRQLIVDSSSLIQDQRAAQAVFPLNITPDVYNAPTLIDHAATATNWSKRSQKPSHHLTSTNNMAPNLHHHHHHLLVPSTTPPTHTHHRAQNIKKDVAQLSPLKKKIKENTPPSDLTLNMSDNYHYQMSKAHYDHFVASNGYVCDPQEVNNQITSKYLLIFFLVRGVNVISRDCLKNSLCQHKKLTYFF